MGYLVHVRHRRADIRPIILQLWYRLRALTAPPYLVLFALRVACVPSMGSELVATAARASLTDATPGPV